MKRMIPLALLTLASGCGGGTPQTSPTAPLLTPSEATYLFDTEEGGPSTHEFVIANRGGGNSSAMTATLTGDRDVFTITADTCSTRALAPGQHCAVTIQLDADLQGSYAGQLHIATADQILDVAVSGRVAPSKLVATLPTAATHVVAGKSATALVTLVNHGGAATGVLAVSEDAHRIVDDHCSGVILSGGGTCTFGVAYTAGIGASGSDTVLVGIGEDLASAIKLTVPFEIDLPPAAVFAVGDGDFGFEDPADPNVKTFTVTNTTAKQSQPISIELSLVTGPVSGTPVFTFVNPSGGCNGAVLGPLASCSFEMTIDPGAPNSATFSAHLTISAQYSPSVDVPIKVQTVPLAFQAPMYMQGTGGGSIGTPWGVICSGGAGGYCGQVWIALSEPTTLVAVPAAGSVFKSWNGTACSGSTSPTCVWAPTFVGTVADISAVFDLK